MSEKKFLNISRYCFKSFPVRLLHSQMEKEGIEPHFVFFKNSTANNHKQITSKEMNQFCDIIRKVKNFA